MEEYAYILDIVPPTRGAKKENICYAVGNKDFKLFQLVYKDNVSINFEDLVYIGKDASKRTVIDHVKKRIGFDELSSTAQSELDYSLSLAVKADEARFVNFFNVAGPISIKKHLLEELPGLGKKGMNAILEERNKEKFKDFADISARVPSVKSPEKLVVARIREEMEIDEKRYLFVEK